MRIVKVFIYVMIIFLTFSISAFGYVLLSSDVIFSEDFELGVLDSRISIETVGNFGSDADIKDITNTGSTKAFGYGRSICGANCFNGYTTRFKITFPTSVFVSTVSFKEMELYGNWGSGGKIYIDGEAITPPNDPLIAESQDFGRKPVNDRQADTTYRQRSFAASRFATVIELVVVDITNSSEIFIDDIVIMGAIDILIAQEPMSGRPGTTFVQWGSGFTANSTAMLHFLKPDGTEYPTQAVSVDSGGHFEVRYTAPFDKPPGTYTWWAVDGSTDQTSNTVSYTIEGISGELHHFIFSDFEDQVGVGVSFPVQIEAVDYNGDRVTSFSGEVSLSHNGPGTLSKSVARLINGYGSSSVSISQPNPSCVISCQHGGITGQSEVFSVTGGQCETGIISGFVKGSIGTMDVILSRSRYGLPVSQVTALSDGRYAFPGVSAGSYYIWVVDNNRKTSTAQSVKIECGQTVRAPDLLIHSSKRPVIFVPGIMGSDKKGSRSRYPKLPKEFPADQSNLDIHNPGSFVAGYSGAVGWEKLNDKLKDTYEIYECPYDWRVSLWTSSDTYKKYLLPIIKKAKEDTGWETVDIVAHSMGGLLVRSYIQSRDYDNDIDRFAMVGTPNQGSLNAYCLWEGGDPKMADEIIGGTTGAAPYFYSHVANNLYRNLYPIDLVDIKSGKMRISNREARSFLWEQCPSIWQLMPTFSDCLMKDGSSKSIEELRNRWLENLNNDSAISKIQTAGSVNTRIFASSSEGTLSQLQVVDSTMSGLYEDGLVEKGPREKSGDGTVLTTSALLPDVAFKSEKKGEHKSLIKEFANDIVEFLNQDRTFADSRILRLAASQPQYSASLGISISGPPSVLLTDPSGTRCGLDQVDGAVYEEIAGSQTLGQSDNAMVGVPDPAAGIFNLKLSGSTPGEATLTLSLLTESKSEEQRFSLHYHGSPLNLSFSLDYAASPMLQISSIPAATTGLTATPYVYGENQLTRLTWQTSTDLSITGYRIYARNEDETDLTQVAQISGAVTQYDSADPWLNPGRIYAVSAIDSEGNESFLSDFAENRDRLLSDFEALPISGTQTLAVHFTDRSTGVPTGWLWNFGDGETSTAQSPEHTYAAPGAYTVSLTVTDADGNQDVEIKTNLIMVKAMGDLTGDYQVDLADVIAVLQIVVGIQPEGVSGTEADVDVDEKIGVADAIYMLQSVSGGR